MSYDLLLNTARDLWDREWEKTSRDSLRGPQAFVHAGATSAMLGSLIDLMAEDPRRNADRLEPVIQRMLFENSFIDDNGDSVVFDTFDHIDVQARILAKVLEDIRQMALRQGIWSGEPAAPMMFG